LSKSFKKELGITIFLLENSSRISSLVNDHSTIPSVHWFSHSPHDFFPVITAFSNSGCLLVISFPLY
jgi:hypothetical protein